MTCGRCIHFTARAASDAVCEPVKDELGAVGICRRYPPRMTRHLNGAVSPLFPNIHRAHVCGEYDPGALCI